MNGATVASLHFGRALEARAHRGIAVRYEVPLKGDAQYVTNSVLPRRVYEIWRERKRDI